jgi:hypothetical protein
MVSPPGRWSSTVKRLVHVRTVSEALAMMDTCAAALSQQRSGVAFSRTEALRIAMMAWLKEEGREMLEIISARR